MAYSMVIYRKKLSDGWTLPYVPAGSLEINVSQSTDTFSSINRNYAIPTAASPMTFSWSGIWPNHSVRWANPKSAATPFAFRKWVEQNLEARAAFHCIVTTTDGTKVVDGDFIMTKFSFNPRRTDDVDISMEFTEYQKVKKTTSSASGSSGTSGASGVSSSSGTTGSASTTTKYTVKIVNCTALNIRKGAGTKYSVAGTLKKGATVSICGKSKDGKWLKLTNGKGYISAAYTKKVSK
jgi:hypothetical protein